MARHGDLCVLIDIARSQRAAVAEHVFGRRWLHSVVVCSTVLQLSQKRCLRVPVPAPNIVEEAFRRSHSGDSPFMQYRSLTARLLLANPSSRESYSRADPSLLSSQRVRQLRRPATWTASKGLLFQSGRDSPKEISRTYTTAEPFDRSHTTRLPHPSPKSPCPVSLACLTTHLSPTPPRPQVLHLTSNFPVSVK